MLLSRFGGPAWLSRILISWGAVASCGIALRNAGGFYAWRIALGAAEAGAYPGMAYYLTGWFTGDEFGEAYAFVTLGSCSSGVLGGPLALALMSLDGVFTLAGWQWLLFVEGLPAIALGCAYTRLLPAGPRSAWFLSPRQRAWLAARNEAASRAKRAGTGAKAGSTSALAAVQSAARNWRVWYLAVVVRRVP